MRNIFFGFFLLLASCASASTTAILESGVGQFGTKDYNRCTVFKTGPKEFIAAGHCVTGLDAQEMAESFYVKWKDEKVKINKFVVGADNDWSVIYTKEDIIDMTALPLDCTSSPYLGQNVILFGFPNKIKGSIYLEGEVTSIEGWAANEKADADFLTNLKVDYGMSGSPTIYSKSGKVIGIFIELFLGGTPYENFFFMSGIESIKHVPRCKENL